MAEWKAAEKNEYGLLPCPFCGGQAITSNWGMFRAWCTECKAKTEDFIRECDAKAAWNRRV